MRSSYRIVPEFYVTPEAHYDGRKAPPIEFTYAIRRADDSLVYRTETHKYAADILANLEYPKTEKKVA